MLDRERIASSVNCIMPAFWTILERGQKVMLLEFDEPETVPFLGASIKKMPAGVYHLTFTIIQDMAPRIEADVIAELLIAFEKFDWEVYSHEGLTFAVKVKEMTSEEAQERAPKHLAAV